jgi:hypothetical protein
MVKLVNPQPLTGLSSLSHVVWAALEKIGHKQMQPKELEQGSSHEVSLHIQGNVDGEPFDQKISSILSVGFEQTKSSSVNPQVPQLIALILSKLNRATRNRILSDIPTEFCDNENQLPDISPVLVDEVEHMLKRLRRSKTVQARGPVRCEYTL